MGLSVRGLIRGEQGLICESKKGKWDDRHNNTEWKSLLENMKKMYRIIRVFTYQRKLVPEFVPLWFKNRNQRVHAGGFMGGGLYEGVLIRGVTQVLRKRWAYLRGPISGRGVLKAEKYGIHSQRSTNKLKLANINLQPATDRNQLTTCKLDSWQLKDTRSQLTTDKTTDNWPVKCLGLFFLYGGVDMVFKVMLKIVKFIPSLLEHKVATNKACYFEKITNPPWKLQLYTLFVNLFLDCTRRNRGQLSFRNVREAQWLKWRICCIDILFCPVVFPCEIENKMITVEILSYAKSNPLQNLEFDKMAIFAKC